MYSPDFKRTFNHNEATNSTVNPAATGTNIVNMKVGIVGGHHKI